MVVCLAAAQGARKKNWAVGQTASQPFAHTEIGQTLGRLCIQHTYALAAATVSGDIGANRCVVISVY